VDFIVFTYNSTVKCTVNCI